MKKRAVLFFLVIRCLLSAQDTAVELEKKLKTVTVPKERIELLYRLATAYKDNSPAATLKYASESLSLSRKEKDTENEAKALQMMGIANAGLGNYEQAVDYYYQAIDIHNSTGNKRGTAVVTISIGNIFWHYSDYEKALEHYNRALRYFEETGDKVAIASIINNRANIFLQWGKLDQALADYIESLKIKEEMKAPQTNIALTLENTGIIYRELGEYNKALEYHEKALDTYKMIGSKMGIARSLNNIGLVYNELEDYPRALDYYQQSLQIKEEIGHKPGIAITLDNIGAIYLVSKDFHKALEYQHKSLALREKMGDKSGIASCLYKIGSIYKEMELYPQALENLNKSLEMAEKSQLKDLLKSNFFCMSEIYYILGDSDKSLLYYKKYTEAKDEIFNQTAINRIRDIQLKYEKEKLQQSNQKSRMKILGIFLGIVLLLVLTLAFLSYNRFRLKNKAQKLLAQSQQEIESQQSKLKVLNDQLKDFLLLKNRKKYEKSSLTPEEADDYHQRLLDFMEKEKPYLDCELTVKDLADRLIMAPKDLSQVINERSGKNFCDFINHYRIEEAKKLLTRSVKDKDMSILNIAFDVGFNSKSSFNLVFKKTTGLTPSQFRKTIKI